MLCRIMATPCRSAAHHPVSRTANPTNKTGWYYWTMTDLMSVSDAKRQLGAVVDRAHLALEPVSLMKRGKRVAVVVDAAEFDRLLAVAEDAEDAQAAEAARREMEETGALPVPWEDVRAELGLT